MARLLRGATHRVTGAARWLFTSLLGLVLVVVGVVMLFTPGSGIAFILLGLYVWAWEFAWARRTLDAAIAKVDKRRERLPKFVGRLLDKRAARKQQKGASERGQRMDPSAVDTNDLALILDLDEDVARSHDTVVLSRREAPDAGA